MPAKKKRCYWLRNTDGRPDPILTMTFIGFVMIILKVFLAGIVVTMGATTWKLGDIDAMVIGAILGPTLGALVSHSYVTKKYGPKQPPDPVESDEAVEKRVLNEEKDGPK